MLAINVYVAFGSSPFTANGFPILKACHAELGVVELIAGISYVLNSFGNNVVKSTLSDVTALLASFGVVIEPSVMIELVGVTRVSVILKLEAAVELFGTVILASTIYGLPAPIDD